MSGTATPPTTGPLLDSERTDARRFCGYPVYGNDAGSNAGYRFFQAYGALEYRLTNLAPAELAVLRAILAILNGLEAAIPASSVNLDTDQAAGWTHNRTEVADRARLLQGWSRRLCAFLGVPPGPGLDGHSLPVVV